jgi:N-methylhydantoinase B
MRRDAADIDAITYEVVRNRLLAVTEEMRIALQSVSGSPTVTEATDFFTGLYLPNGDFATMGFQVTMEAPPVGGLIRHIRGKENLPLRPGDMFIGNDPFIGALHQNDVQMAAPIYHDREVIAWAGVMAHETDMGGMDFASWSPKAREVYQEGIRIPAVKLVDQGEIREDVLEFILAASRLPHALGLDIRAFIATLNVAADRLTTLVARYGIAVIRGAMERMIDVSEARTRERLAELPDAVVHVANFLEHDGHENRLYKIDLVLTKRDDTLRLDFGGSSPQAPGFINTTRAGLRGGVTSALLPILGFDIPWNEGLLRPVEIVAPEGLVCTAQHPAPVGAGTVEAIWTIGNAVSDALNKLYSCSPKYASRAQAVSSGTMATFNLGGVNQFGERFGLHLLDPIAGGFGAFATKDGVDSAGPMCVPMPAIADVEANEQVAPLRYLYRRLARDTGGAGRWRGGRGAEIALTLAGIESATALVMTHGLEVPNSVGQSGGWPGATVRQRFGRDVLPGGRYPAGALPEDPAAIAGDWEEFGPKPGLLPMTNADVYAVSWQGGGGFGDPLEREPGIVAADVRSGAVSPEAARRVYGVVVTDGAVDHGETAMLRSGIRHERIGAEHLDAFPTEELSGLSLGPALRLVRGSNDWEVRSRAGHLLAVGSTAWRAGAHAVALGVEDFPGGTLQLHDDLAITAFYCPASGTLLALDVHRRDEIPVDDVLLDLDKLSMFGALVH